MTRARQSVVVLLVLSLAVALGPPLYRTAKWSDSAGDLVVLASLNPDDYSLNPWSQDCYLIGPDRAVWILENFDWPYSESENYGLFGIPILHSAIVETTPHTTRPDVDAVTGRMLRLIAEFIRRGEPIESRLDGLTALHSAILFANVEAVKILVESGADLNATIQKPGKSTDGLNAIEFAGFLRSNSPDEYDEILDYLSSMY